MLCFAVLRNIVLRCAAQSQLSLQALFKVAQKGYRFRPHAALGMADLDELNSLIPT